MSLRTQSLALARRATRERREIYSVECVWRGDTYCVAATGIRTGSNIEAGGFEFEPDASIRIDTCKYPLFKPASRDTLTFGSTVVQATYVTPLLNSGEIKVALAKA